LDLIKELGFELERDQNKRYFIKGGMYDAAESFTHEEVTLLKELLLSSG
jgi:hypothetical protein